MRSRYLTVVEVDALAGEPLRRGDRVRLERGYAIRTFDGDPFEGVADPFGDFNFVPNGAPVKVVCRAAPKLAEVGAAGLVVDESRNLVICAGVEHDLSRKHALRDFIYYLVRRANTSVPKEQILRDVWKLAGDYHPLRHDPNLHSHAASARKILGKERVNFYYGDDALSMEAGGFAFEPPEHFLHVALD